MNRPYRQNEEGIEYEGMHYTLYETTQLQTATDGLKVFEGVDVKDLRGKMIL